MWARKRRSICRVAQACLAAGGIAVCVGAVAEPTMRRRLSISRRKKRNGWRHIPVIRIGAETIRALRIPGQPRVISSGVVADYIDIIRYTAREPASR